MIDLTAKIHDKFTLEFKVGFNTEETQHPLNVNDFVMNTWIFVPNSLDINAVKYSKDDFYRDLKSDVRLITPDYPLHNIANDAQLLPNQSLADNSNDLLIAPDDIEDFVHSAKMYCAIAKSSFRKAFLSASQKATPQERHESCTTFLEDVEKVVRRYRELYHQLKDKPINERSRQVFSYGDEFLSNILEQYTYRLRDTFHHNHPEEYASLEDQFKTLLLNEKAYKKSQGYLFVAPDDAQGNSDFVFRSSLLKKFAESDLFLSSNKRKNTFLVEQILYSAAAGIAMLMATVSSFFFQQRYGNFTLPFLVALVIGYMFKDRLKDWLRLAFARRVSSKIFDTRTDFRIKGRRIGWSKDSMDFIDGDKVLPEVMQLRNRMPLFDEVSGRDEKILLYRKKVQVWRRQLAKASPFPLKGINDIIRYNITEYTRKMDNPTLPLSGSWKEDDYKPIVGEKIYRLTFVFQCVFEGKTEYKRVLVLCNKNGIISVE